MTQSSQTQRLTIIALNGENHVYLKIKMEVVSQYKEKIVILSTSWKKI